jgi:hypothetical protein
MDGTRNTTSAEATVVRPHHRQSRRMSGGTLRVRGASMFSHPSGTSVPPRSAGQFTAAAEGAWHLVRQGFEPRRRAGRLRDRLTAATVNFSPRTKRYVRIIPPPLVKRTGGSRLRLAGGRQQQPLQASRRRTAWSGTTKMRPLEERIHDFERLPGRKTVEVGILKRGSPPRGQNWPSPYPDGSR